MGRVSHRRGGTDAKAVAIVEFLRWVSGANAARSRVEQSSCPDPDRKEYQPGDMAEIWSIALLPADGSDVRRSGSELATLRDAGANRLQIPSKRRTSEPLRPGGPLRIAPRWMPPAKSTTTSRGDRLASGQLDLPCRR